MTHLRPLATLFFLTAVGAAATGGVRISAPLIARAAENPPASARGPAISLVKYDSIIAKPGDNITVWWGINLRGKIHYRILTRDGTNRANLWWIRGPFGSIKSIGNRTGDGKVDIPGFSGWAKLRAGGFQSETIIFFSEDASVANVGTFHF